MAPKLVKELFNEMDVKMNRRTFIKGAISLAVYGSLTNSFSLGGPPFMFLRWMTDIMRSRPSIVERINFPRPGSRADEIFVMKPRSYDDRLTFSSLQGLNNRKKADIFLSNGDTESSFWLN